MRAILLTILLVAGTIVHGQSAHRLAVQVSDTRPGTVLYVRVLDAEGGQLLAQQKPVEAGSTLVEMGDLPSGRYAVELFQDANGNGELDLGRFGIPKEGTGCSNNATGFMSAPALKDMLFDLKGPTTLEVTMRYY